MASEWLRARVSAPTVIGWTALPVFYGRAYAHVWRTGWHTLFELPRAGPESLR